MLGRVEAQRSVGRQRSGIHVGTGAAVARLVDQLLRAAATQALGIEGGRGQRRHRLGGRCGAGRLLGRVFRQILADRRDLRSPGGRGLWRDGRPHCGRGHGRLQHRLGHRRSHHRRRRRRRHRHGGRRRGGCRWPHRSRRRRRRARPRGHRRRGRCGVAAEQPAQQSPEATRTSRRRCRCRCGRHHRCSGYGRRFRRRRAGRCRRRHGHGLRRRLRGRRDLLPLRRRSGFDDRLSRSRDCSRRLGRIRRRHRRPQATGAQIGCRRQQRGRRHRLVHPHGALDLLGLGRQRDAGPATASPEGLPVQARLQRVEVEDGHIGHFLAARRKTAAAGAREEEIQHRLRARRQGQKGNLQSGLQLGGFH